MAEEKVNRLATEMIRTERAKLATAAERCLRQIREESGARGVLYSTIHGHALDRASAEEYESRATAWLTIVCRLADELAIQWAKRFTQDMQALVTQELSYDWNEVYGRLEAESEVLAGVGGMQARELMQAQNLVRRRVEEEFALLELKHDCLRAPLDDRLAADRYAAVASSWEKAMQPLETGQRATNDAVRAGVAAVEELARIVCGDASLTLGDAIKALRHSGRIEAPLLKGMEELWGRASDKPGLRHGAAPDIDPAEAQYLLKLCEAALGILLAGDAP